MIPDTLPPPTPQQAAETMVHYFNAPDNSRYAVQFADLLYDGVYLPADFQRAVDIYSQVIAKGDITAEKMENIAMRTVDFYLRQKCFDLATGPAEKLSYKAVSGLLEIQKQLGSGSGCAFCYALLFKLSKDSSPDTARQLATTLVQFFCKESFWSQSEPYLPYADLNAISPENLMTLAEHFYQKGSWETAILCLLKLVADQNNPDNKMSILLFHALCKVKRFQEAAEIFNTIPEHLLSENTVYMGIAAMTAAGNYRERILQLCYEVCTQHPQAEKAPLYARQLQEACLEAHCYKEALLWAQKAGDSGVATELDAFLTRTRQQRNAAMTLLIMLFVLLPLLALASFKPIMLWKTIPAWIIGGFYLVLCINSIKLLNQKLTAHYDPRTGIGSGQKMFVAAYAVFSLGVLLNQSIASLLHIPASLFLLAETLFCAAVVGLQLRNRKYPAAFIDAIVTWRDVKLWSGGIIAGITASAVLLHFFGKHWEYAAAAPVAFYLVCALFSAKKTNTGN